MGKVPERNVNVSKLPAPTRFIKERKYVNRAKVESFKISIFHDSPTYICVIEDSTNLLYIPFDISNI